MNRHTLCSLIVRPRQEFSKNGEIPKNMKCSLPRCRSRTIFRHQWEWDCQHNYCEEHLDYYWFNERMEW